MASSKSLDTCNEDSTTEDKRRIIKKHKLNGYNKRSLLTDLIQNGCAEKNCKDIVYKFPKVDPANIESYINKAAENAQEYVCEEINSKLYSSLDTWATAFKKRGYADGCNYELPIVFETIAEGEEHPTFREAGGIDFKKLYQCLANLMRGFPTPDLNIATHAYLCSILEKMMKNVNSQEGERQLPIVREAAQRNAKIIVENTAGTMSDINLDSGLNSLQLPVSLPKIE